MKQAAPPRLYGLAFIFFIGVYILASLLVLDNYDSFTYNLVQMFKNYELDIHVVRSDKISLKKVLSIKPDYILISPGPKDPAHAGISTAVIKNFYKEIPILGVCLGMQCINEAFGGKTIRAPLPMHGKTSSISHSNRSIFKGIPKPYKVARYHSLMSEFKSDVLEITAKTNDGVIMGLSHPDFPLAGVQFHPESFLTENGYQIIENFLRLGPLASTIN